MKAASDPVLRMGVTRDATDKFKWIYTLTQVMCHCLDGKRKRTNRDATEINKNKQQLQSIRQSPTREQNPSRKTYHKKDIQNF